ncbi:MAG: AgmX/PglI C-terminal domain-containing protein [Polyangia bacterium]
MTTLVLVCAALALSACARHVPPPKVPEAPVAEEQPTSAPAAAREDGMQLEGQLGTLSGEDIAGAFKTRWPDVTRCSRSAQDKLYYLHGTVQLKVRVGPDGAAESAYVEHSTLGSWEAEQCVLQVARGLVFPSPRGGKEAEFSYPIEVRARRPSPMVDWDEARIAPTVLRSKHDVGVCRGDAPRGPHKKHAKRTALTVLPSNLSLTLYVAPGGHVSSLGLAGEGPIDEAFASCLMTHALTWKVDDPRGRIAKATFAVVQ